MTRTDLWKNLSSIYMFLRFYLSSKLLSNHQVVDGENISQQHKQRGAQKRMGRTSRCFPRWFFKGGAEESTSGQSFETGRKRVRKYTSPLFTLDWSIWRSAVAILTVIIQTYDATALWKKRRKKVHFCNAFIEKLIIQRVLLHREELHGPFRSNGTKWPNTSLFDKKRSKQNLSLCQNT